jgi:hypothetical protein
MRAARHGVRSPASLQVTGGDNLVLGPNSDGEGVGSTAQDSVLAVRRAAEGCDDSAPTDPDRGGGQRGARLAALPLMPSDTHNGGVMQQKSGNHWRTPRFLFPQTDSHRIKLLKF